ncbi:endoplasmic reticulum metallopeptidase 1-like, partial [Morus notabilis]|uniref:endoplasmic reticulum metallopeptidase 1-like n=1 Tax=Morus notabilis TaxID=981085 RepID=UPI000CED42F0
CFGSIRGDQEDGSLGGRCSSGTFQCKNWSILSAENTILVSSHIDTVFSAEGAGDCSSCVAVMLELARGVSQWAHGFKNGVIFLFNTGEEEGLTGAHSFVTQ